jgi:5'-nucleotidase
MIDWKKIDTVLLDMDGTLLDLHFDNYFWKEFVPVKFAELHQLPVDVAKQQLVPRFKSMEGRLEWYCLDYWSDALQLDIVALKADCSHLIAVLPHVIAFLEKLKGNSCKVILVTNAHRDSLALKMQRTELQHLFDNIISSHDFGMPKEHLDFWLTLQKNHAFEKHNTVLIDDSLVVLNSAKQFGIAHLIAINKPDTQLPKRHITEYPAIDDFRALMIGL